MLGHEGRQMPPCSVPRASLASVDSDKHTIGSAAPVDEGPGETQEAAQRVSDNSRLARSPATNPSSLAPPHHPERGWLADRALCCP